MIANIQDNVRRVEERIASACQRSDRKREEVRLVAISKTHPAAAVRKAYAAGLRDFGENRVQEARSKLAELADLDLIWHLVGHLQSNKAKMARELFRWVHSVDSFRLAERLAQAGNPNDPPLPVLIEVNLGQEASKAGVRAEHVAELAEQVAKINGHRPSRPDGYSTVLREPGRGTPLFSTAPCIGRGNCRAQPA